MEKFYKIVGFAVIVIICAVVLLYGINYYFKTQGESSMVGGRSYETPKSLLTASSSIGWTTPIRVDDYRNVVLMLSATNTPTLTVKFAGSNYASSTSASGAPDFNLPSSANNHWDYIEVVDLQNGNTIDGDTGISFSGSSDQRNFEVNSELITWFAAQISSYTAGTTTLQVKYGTNQ